MAKTYEEWEKEARDEGLYDSFSDKDIENIKNDTAYGDRLLGYKREYNSAATEEGRRTAAEKANYERLNYGYYNTNEANAGGGFSAKSHTASGSGGGANSALAALLAYDKSVGGNNGSKYASIMNGLLSSLIGDKFSYNAEDDPRYKLSQEYAQRAMENQMAESAILSGGYGNSYAAASGQAVYDDYMDGAVTDMENNAYNRWAAERDNKYNLLGVVQGLEQQEYNRTENERQWNYTLDKDAKADADAAQTNAQDYVYSYIKMHGSTEGLSEDRIAATGWDRAYIDAIAAQTQREREEELGVKSEEQLTKNDALVEQYYTLGLPVPEELLANSHYAGRTDLVAGYSDYYKTKIGNENALESINIAKGYKALQDTSVEETLAKNDALIEQYVALGLMPPAKLIANSSYADHEVLLQGYIDNAGVRDDVVLDANATKTELLQLARGIMSSGDRSIVDVAKIGALLRDALTQGFYTIKGESALKDIIDTMRSSGIVDEYGQAMLYKALNINWDWE